MIVLRAPAPVIVTSSDTVRTLLVPHAGAIESDQSEARRTVVLALVASLRPLVAQVAQLTSEISATSPPFVVVATMASERRTWTARAKSSAPPRPALGTLADSTRLRVAS